VHHFSGLDGPHTTHSTASLTAVIRSPEATATTIQVGLPVATTNGVSDPAPAVGTSSPAQTGAVQATKVSTHPRIANGDIQPPDEEVCLNLCACYM